MVFKSHDAWRKHPKIANQWKNMLPGLGIATAIFAVYCFQDWFVKEFSGTTISYEMS